VSEHPPGSYISEKTNEKLFFTILFLKEAHVMLEGIVSRTLGSLFNLE
jgi:hypothetical protein